MYIYIFFLIIKETIIQFITRYNFYRSIKIYFEDFSLILLDLVSWFSIYLLR